MKKTIKTFGNVFNQGKDCWESSPKTCQNKMDIKSVWEIKMG